LEDSPNNNLYRNHYPRGPMLRATDAEVLAQPCVQTALKQAREEWKEREPAMGDKILWIKRLREATGAGLMDAKNAAEQSGWNFEAAKNLLWPKYGKIA
jgi:ribosomal protein L7/L12